jgi:putative transposase
MKVEYNNLYTHFVFTTLHREKIIPERSRKRIEKYITGIVSNHGCHLYSIYANPDHMHMLVSRAPDIDERRLANIVASSSEKFINENKLTRFDFRWQGSCAAFSVSKSDIDKICKYILNQPVHHKKHSFQEEYDKFSAFYQKTFRKDSNIQTPRIQIEW